MYNALNEVQELSQHILVELLALGWFVNVPSVLRQCNSERQTLLIQTRQTVTYRHRRP